MVSSAMGPDAAATPLFPAEKPPLSGSPGRAAPSCPVPKGSLIPAGPEALPEPAAPPPPQDAPPRESCTCSHVPSLTGREGQAAQHRLPRLASSLTWKLLKSDQKGSAMDTSQARGSCYLGRWEAAMESPAPQCKLLLTRHLGENPT